MRFFHCTLICIYCNFCGTWPLTVREAHRGRYIGHSEVNGTGNWINLHDEDLTNMYYSSERIVVIELRKKRWACHVARRGRDKKCIQLCSWNLKRETSSRPKPRNTWKDNIKMGFKELGWEVVYWIRLVLNTDQRYTLLNFLSSRATFNFSTWTLIYVGIGSRVVLRTLKGFAMFLLSLALSRL